MRPFKATQLSKDGAESYSGNCLQDPEPEEDPEEPEEDPEEDPENDAELDPEEVIEEHMGEDTKGNVNDEPSVEDPDEDPSEEDPDEDPSEEDPDEDPSEEDPNEDPSEGDPDEDPSEEDPDENPSEEDPDEDPSEENPDEDPPEVCVSQPSSRHDSNLTDHSATENAYQSKTSKYKDAKQGLAHDAAVEVIRGISAVSKSVGDTEGASANVDHHKKSEKQRRSRWEQQPQQYLDSSHDGNENGKRRKTRWDSYDSQLKTPGPCQIKKDFVESELDSVLRRLKVRLTEINSKLSSPEVQDDRPERERSPSPEPVYNNLGIRVNTREVRFREKLNKERQRIIAKLMKKNPVFETPVIKPTKLFKKLYIPVKEHPTYNFVGLILGPRGNTHKSMEKETGAKILLRGKGSGRTLHKTDPTDDEDLHVCIEAGDQKSLDAAVMMVKKLLVPQDDQMNDHKLAQLQELAKLKGTYRDENFCKVCKEEGHKTYACPHRASTLKTIISCNTCGSSSHPTFTCPLTVSSQVNKPGPNHSTQGKPKKEIDESNLYVAYLPQIVHESRLRELFSPFGKITSSTVMNDQNTGLSKGFGFVKFENAMDAATAVMHLNGYHIEGHRLAVRVAGTPPAGTGFPALNPLPLYSRHATHNPDLNQATWPGQPVSTLPAVQVPYPYSVGRGLPHSFTSSGHGTQLPSIGSTNFSIPAISTLNESRDASKSCPHPSIGSTNLSSPVISTLNESKGALQSPSLLAQFPGDPDYRSTGFQSFFAKPTL